MYVYFFFIDVKINAFISIAVFVIESCRTVNPFVFSPHDIKPPLADLYQLDVRNVKSAPVAGRKLTFGTSSRLEKVKDKVKTIKLFSPRVLLFP